MGYRHNPVYDKLNQMVAEGKAMLAAIPTDFLSGVATNVQPGVGQCAVINRIVGMAAPTFDTATPSLTGGVASMTLYDSDGQEVVGGAPYFLTFQRNNLEIVGANTPSWHSAVPCGPVDWRLSNPLIVPSKWTLKSTQSVVAASQGFACYGWIIDNATARLLGLDPNGSLTSTDRRYGCVGIAFTGSEATIIAGRSGKCIQLLDVYIRQQQITHGGTITGTIRESSTDRTIFKFCSNNPIETAEWKFSPSSLYLTAGEGLEILGDSGIRATITVIYRYVNEDEVPSDAWWSYIAPNFPTPASSQPSGAISSIYRVRTNELTCYYPKTGDTKTSPTTGFQHIVEGYAFSLQGDRTASADILVYGLTTGTTGSTGAVAAATQVAPSTNKLIAPIIGKTSHDQCIYLAVDDLYLPCPKDDGKLFIDAMTVGPSAIVTPTTQDADTDEWHCLVWGRTAPTEFGTNHFRGGAS